MSRINIVKGISYIYKSMYYVIVCSLFLKCGNVLILIIV